MCPICNEEFRYCKHSVEEATRHEQRQHELKARATLIIDHSHDNPPKVGEEINVFTEHTKIVIERVVHTRRLNENISRSECTYSIHHTHLSKIDGVKE